MLAYIARRILMMFPVILGVVLLTFFLFAVAAPDPALAYAGKHRSPEILQAIRHQMGLDKPLWINPAAARETGHFSQFFNTQFFDVLLLRAPESMHYKESVWSLFKRKAPVSFAIQFPVFVVVLGINLVLAILSARRRGKPTDWTITVAAVALLSIPSLSVYLAGQSILGGQFRLFPVAGWATGWGAIHFAALPILVAIAFGWGGGARFYRTVVLEEMGQDYVRTARAKGVGEREVLFTHIMRNIMIPVITNTVTALPGLFLGALLLERIFQIPGIGGMLVDAIFNSDRPIVMYSTYAIAIAYAIMLLINDILYTFADPRVSLR